MILITEEIITEILNISQKDLLDISLTRKVESYTTNLRLNLKLCPVLVVVLFLVILKNIKPEKLHIPSIIIGLVFFFIMPGDMYVKIVENFL